MNGLQLMTDRPKSPLPRKRLAPKSAAPKTAFSMSEVGKKFDRASSKDIAQ